MTNAEIRKDFLLDKYVIIAPGRASRPRRLKEKSRFQADSKCFFCPENLAKDLIIDQIDQNGRWQVAAIANIYPAVSLGNENAYGTQEVIIEQPGHHSDISRLDAGRIRIILEMYARRTTVLSQNRKLDYILCLKNQGPGSGASLPHAHSQIFATALLPPDIKNELSCAHNYQRCRHICPYCELIQKEAAGPRLIWHDRHIIAIAPYASEFHYEAWIFTKRHLDNISRLSSPELDSFAAAYAHILRKLDSLGLSFNAFMHQVLSDHNQHFYFKIQPRASVWGGVELGSGLIINTTPPEEAAKFYRE